VANGAHNHTHEHEHLRLDKGHPIWRMDRIDLKSIGIDIGSTTSHLMVSDLVLRRQGIALSSRFHIVSKKVVYKSKILITPFLHSNVIDATALSDFITAAYNEALVTPEDIDTGAVILTGEAAKKDNAESIAKLFSAKSGKFICATAGPNLEAKMAAYGSGAVEKSLSPEGGLTIMNVDIGGGTSKIAIVCNGVLCDTATINVGARLIALEDTGTVVRIEDPAQVIASELGMNLRIGSKLGKEEQVLIAKLLADSLMEIIQRERTSFLTQKLMLTSPLSFKERIEAVIFSGGVSEYIYGLDSGSYGDLGGLLAQEIIKHISSPEFGIRIEAPLNRIRATVIGASQYTVQVSGSTIFISNENILPLRNLQVVLPRIEQKVISDEYIRNIIQESLYLGDINLDEHSPVALAFHWPLEPSFELINSLVKGIASALATSISGGMPIVLVFDADIGGLVGNMLKHELECVNNVVSIDGIELQDFDYIDIGRSISEFDVVPVVIKSLVFRASPPN
jgi:ethanolamine utilization protein EutA